jgi:putative colanic acid biosysnthesis UDP-glucose lipid carrier transferase
MTVPNSAAASLSSPAKPETGNAVRQFSPTLHLGNTMLGASGFAPTPPQSISSFIAGIAEPAVSVLALMIVTLAFGEPIDRATRLLALVVMVLTFPGSNRFHSSRVTVAGGIVGSWFTVTCLLLLVGYATDTFKFFNKHALLTWLVLTPLLHGMVATAGHIWLRQRARHAHARRRALVIGAGELGLRVAAMLRQRSDVGHDFIGFVEDRELARCPAKARSDVIGDLQHVDGIIRKHNIRDAYITLPLGSQTRMSKLISALQDSAVTLYFVPDVFGVNAIQGRMRNLDGVPVVGLLESPFIGTNALLKRASDVVISSLILVMIAPLMLAIAIGIKRTSPGPAIFKQRRHGLDGREIVVYKFRSMTTQDNGPVVQQATRNDPRVTPFGAFLRRTSLDELPQFINVLQGRMSIVGPRPHALAHNEQYRELIKAYMVRHKVRPGITGWAQVNGSRGETDTTEKMAERLRLDIEYLRNWSLGLDLRIIARTAGLTLFDRNAY